MDDTLDKSSHRMLKIGPLVHSAMWKHFQNSPPVSLQHERAILILLGANRLTEESVRILCLKSKPADAMILVRAMFERLFNLKYIMHEPSKREELATQFLESKILGEKRRLEFARRSDAPRHLRMDFGARDKQIDEDYERFRAKYKLSSKRVPLYWHSKSSISELAKSVGELARYEVFNGAFSEFVHHEGIAKQGVDSDNSLRITAGTAWPGLEICACGYAVDILLDSWESYASAFQHDAIADIRMLQGESRSASTEVIASVRHDLKQNGVN